MGAKVNRSALDKIERRVRERAVEVINQGYDALDETITEAEIDVVNNLEAAHTRTGLVREEFFGGLPGRHETGKMVYSVDSEIRDETSTLTRGVWGWWGSNYEEYFRDQDQGEGKIPAARALPDSEIVARERFRARLARIGKRRG